MLSPCKLFTNCGTSGTHHDCTSRFHQVLAVPGLVLVSDHTPFDDSPRSIALYMTEQEQQQALADARFANVHVELAMNGLMLYAGEKSA